MATIFIFTIEDTHADYAITLIYAAMSLRHQRLINGAAISLRYMAMLPAMIRALMPAQRPCHFATLLFYAAITLMICALRAADAADYATNRQIYGFAELSPPSAYGF